MPHGVRAVARRHAVGSLMVIGVLGLLVAGFLFLDVPIIKISGPEAFEVIEKRYVDFARVDADKETRRDYEFLKGWIMRNEPSLGRRLGRANAVGIGFSLLVSLCCLRLGFDLRRIRDAARRADQGGDLGSTPSR